MSEQAFNRCVEFRLLNSRVLRFAIAFWFLVAVVGQWMLVIYFMLYYGGSLVNSQLHGLKEVLADYPDVFLFILNLLNV